MKQAWIGIKVGTDLKRRVNVAIALVGSDLSKIGRQIWAEWADQVLAEKEADVENVPGEQETTVQYFD